MIHPSSSRPAHRGLAAYALLALLLCPAGAPAAALQPDKAKEAVTLRPRFERGRVLTYHLVSDTTVQPLRPAIPAAPDNAPATPPPPPTRVVHDATIRLTTLSVDDSGAATFVGVLTHLKVTVTVDGHDSTVDLSAPPPPASAPGTPHGADQPPAGDAAQDVPADPLADIASALISSLLRIDAGPDGAITELTGLEDARKVAAGSPRRGLQLLGPFGPHAASNLGVIFRLGPAEPVAPRATWSLTDRFALSPAVTLVRIYECTLATLADAVATVTATGSLTIDHAPGDPDAAAVGYAVDDGALSLGAHWDTARGLLIDRTAEQSARLTANLGPATSAARTTSRLTITLTDVGQAPPPTAPAQPPPSPAGSPAPPSATPPRPWPSPAPSPSPPPTR